MRAKVRQIMDENHWSQDKMAFELGVDTFALRRWMMAAPPETRRHLADLIDVEHKVEAFIRDYTGPQLVKVVTSPLHRGGSLKAYTGRRQEVIPEWQFQLSKPIKIGPKR